MRPLVLVAALGSAGCATILSSSRQTVSLPSAADTSLRVAVVSREGTVLARGAPPLGVEVQRRGEYLVVVQGGAGPADTTALEKRFNAVTLWNVLVWPGFFVDLASGALRRHVVPSTLYATERSSKQVAVTQQGVETLRRQLLQLELGRGVLAVWATNRSQVEIGAGTRTQSEVCAMDPADAIAWGDALRAVSARSIQVPEGVESSLDLPQSPGFCDLRGVRVTGRQTSYSMSIRTPLTPFGLAFTLTEDEFKRFAVAVREAGDLSSRPASFSVTPQ